MLQKLINLLNKIETKKSLAENTNQVDLHWNLTKPKKQKDIIYENQEGRINFRVTRLPLRLETLESRVVEIERGNRNELHVHAHEAIFIILSGEGRIRIDDNYIQVKTGDVIAIPRWCKHQCENTSTETMRVLAVTDFGLTSAVLGDYTQQTRKQKNA